MKHSLPLRALSRLLQYPDQELMEHLTEVAESLYGMPKLSKKVQSGLVDFVKNLQTSDLFDSQENYVECFDRGRATSLHLFEHVHGDSRERGQAMVDLLLQAAKAAKETLVSMTVTALLEMLLAKIAVMTVMVIIHCS